MAHRSDSRSELDSSDNQRVQWRDWVLERVGWGLIGITLAAAAAGLLGPGPLSSRETSSADGRLRVEYEGFVRRAAPAHLRISLRPASSEMGEAQIGISSSFIQAAKIEQIAPQPLATETASDQTVYTFAVEPGVELLKLVFRYEPDERGSLAYDVSAGNDSTVPVRQFIFP